MKYEIAKKENIEQIYQLVQNTINAILKYGEEN